MSKQHLQCQTCQCDLAKAEAQFVDEETFGLLSQPPEGVSLGVYCNPCFEAQVRPALDAYLEKVELAKNVNVFLATQSKESRFVRRTEKPIRVEECLDRDEALLRLALMAVELNKNALVDVDFSSRKIRNGGWQTARWSGRGIPANIEESQLQRRFIGAPN